MQVAVTAAQGGTIPGVGKGVGLGVGTGEDGGVGVGLGEALGEDRGEADADVVEWLPQPASATIATRATSLMVEGTPPAGC